MLYAYATLAIRQKTKNVKKRILADKCIIKFFLLGVVFLNTKRDCDLIGVIRNGFLLQLERIRDELRSNLVGD